MYQGIDQRGYDRQNSETSIFFASDNADPFQPAKLLNFGIGGLNIESKTAIQPGSDFFFKMATYPSEMYLLKAHEGAIANVKWCKKSLTEKTGNFQVGVQFLKDNNQISNYRNTHEMLEKTVKHYPDTIAFRRFTGKKQMASVTWRHYYQQVKQVSKCLMALDIDKGDKVIILSSTCYQWVLADLGITSIGGCTVGIYKPTTAEDCRYIIDHSDAVMIFAEDKMQLKKLLKIRKEIPHIKKVVLFKGRHIDHEWIMSFREFMQLESGITDKAFRERVNQVTPIDPATIAYTSGTTGMPKGVVLTHDNLTFNAQSTLQSCDIREEEEGFLSLPLAHILSRNAVQAALFAGNPGTFAHNAGSVFDDVKAAKPHFFPGLPEIYEKLYIQITGRIEAKGGLTLKIFKWACDVGNELLNYQLEKQPVPPLIKVKYKLATQLVFSKIHHALGGRIRWCGSSGAPLREDVNRFFHIAGIPLLEGFGLTEVTGTTNINRLDNFKIGWVGPPCPGIEQKLSDDGEVMFRGRGVMNEYYKMPEETAKAITQDGWLRTGNLGKIDANNFLKIIGHKNELIITSSGKRISPSAVESIICTSKYIRQACVIGNGRHYIAALITLYADNIKAFAKEKHIVFYQFDDLAIDEQIRQLIGNEIRERNKALSSLESIKAYTVVPEFTIENGLITPIYTMKRDRIHDKYKMEIDALYPEKLSTCL